MPPMTRITAKEYVGFNEKLAKTDPDAYTHRRKVGGRRVRQPGQDRKVAAVTNFVGSSGLPLS